MAISERDTRTLDLYTDLVSAALRAYYTPDCCIAASRITIEVLRALGYSVEAVPVSVSIFNPQYTAHINAGELPPQSREEAILLGEIDGSWAIGLGIMGTPESEITPTYNGKRGWNGHLVTLIDGRILMDLTIGQASRPDHGIVLAPAWAELPDPEAFLSGKRAAIFQTGADCMLTYRHEPTNQGYRAAGDWSPRKSAKISGPIIRAMRRMLSVGQKEQTNDTKDDSEPGAREPQGGEGDRGNESGDLRMAQVAGSQVRG